MSCTITKINSKTRGKHKNAPRDFKASVTYIIDAKGHGDKILVLDNQEMIFGLNMESDNIESWKQEIGDRHKQFKSYKNKGDPTAHYIISYKKNFGETLSAERLKAHTQIALYHLGYDEHKAICAAHANTEHVHIHIIVDKLSPDLRKGKLYIPMDVGTVLLPDKKNDRILRHDALCQHAAMYDICQAENWNTDHCLVNSLGQKIKQQKKSLPKNVVKEEIRTGEKSTQRILYEILESHTPPKNHSQALTLFEKLKDRGVTYEIKYNKKDNSVKGLVYKLDGKTLASSKAPIGFEHKAILPLLSPPPPPTKQDNIHLLYSIIDGAMQRDLNYDNLHAKLTEIGFHLKESGGSFRIINNDTEESYKLSEISRKFSKKTLDKAFQENADKHKENQETFVKSSSHHHIYDDLQDQQDLQDQLDQHDQADQIYQQQFNQEMEFTYEQPSL